ncbi:hypothetical protein LV779_20075 [Streptomyces thinghirensis]|nr:hypothetical protein [Streptomyces thinghirensis]
MGTGRVPAQQPGAQVPEKPVVYSRRPRSDQLAAYIASLGAGPAIPSEEKYAPEGADIARAVSCSATTAR